jgi:ferritin
MISKRLHDAINAQINAEFWSAYLYLAMSVDASNKGNKGVANWFMVQFKEEQAHAQIFINYLLSRGCRVELAPIAEVKTSWDSPMDAFKETLEHEKKVTALIHNLYAIAVEEKDYASQSMLTWFIDEQVEEEENALDIIDSLEKVEGSKMGLYMIDKDLATRTYTVPAPLAGKE